MAPHCKSVELIFYHIILLFQAFVVESLLPHSIISLNSMCDGPALDCSLAGPELIIE
jgi:hypothetical protein